MSPVVMAGWAAVAAFVGTLTVGTASTDPGYGPFPAMTAAKRVWRAWFWDFGRRRRR